MQFILEYVVTTKIVSIETSDNYKYSFYWNMR